MEEKKGYPTQQQSGMYQPPGQAPYSTPSMYPPNDIPIQQQQPGMYYPPAQAPYADPSMYSQNNMNTMSAPPSYDQATQPIPQPR